MGKVINLQSYKDFISGLITEEQYLKGETYFPKEWQEKSRQGYSIFDIYQMGERTRPKKDWSKEPHHPVCCCDKCAPTKEIVQEKIELHKKMLGESDLTPSDCEP
jgi:hypothetical protein